MAFPIPIPIPIPIRSPNPQSESAIPILIGPGVPRLARTTVQLSPAVSGRVSSQAEFSGRFGGCQAARDLILAVVARGAGGIRQLQARHPPIPFSGPGSARHRGGDP